MNGFLKVEHSKRQLVMSREFAKFANDTMSEEYAHLQRVRQDYPLYEVVLRTITRNSNKESYKGLTYEYMEDYILTHGTQEERKKTYDEYNELRLIAECHSKAYRYPTIKRWFLNKYPEIMEFGMKVQDVAIPQEPVVQELPKAA